MVIKNIILAFVVLLAIIAPVQAMDLDDFSCSILFKLYGMSHNTNEGDYLFISQLDFNEDSSIDISDLAILASNYGDNGWCGDILEDINFENYLGNESCSLVSDLFEFSYNTNEGDDNFYDKFDFNDDDSIDLSDLAILASNYSDEDWCLSLLVEEDIQEKIEKSFSGVLGEQTPWYLEQRMNEIVFPGEGYESSDVIEETHLVNVQFEEVELVKESFLDKNIWWALLVLVFVILIFIKAIVSDRR
ncbi:hypothetical protein HOG16_01805 [Candidatus Woesearchaeota archaeon]|nr:hypothetical protein [Candidatus Woesearchaeota archaeon]